MAIQGMQKRWLVRPAQGRGDKRKWNVFLTAEAKELKHSLIPLARQVVGTALQGFSPSEIARLLEALTEVQRNLQATITQFDGIGLEIQRARRSKRRATTPSTKRG